MKSCIIYENIRVEMARRDLTIIDIANRIGMSRTTLSRKLSGKSPFLVDEAFAIQKACFPDVDVTALFKECSVK